MQSLIKNISLSYFLFICVSAIAQKSNKYVRANEKASSYQYSTENCSARGIYLLNNKLYLGNSDGTLICYDLESHQTVNFMKGKNFQEMRDIAYSNGYLFGMQSGTNGLLARINETDFVDFVFPKKNLWSNIFLDGIDFYEQTGFIMGDPTNGNFNLFYSENGGQNWIPCEGKLEAMAGEAGFAASGTNVQVLNDSTFMFVSGGLVSRFFKSTDKGKSWTSVVIPFLSSDASGAFSLHFINELEGVIVGGDYKNPAMTLNNAYYTEDGGEFWINPDKSVNGYRSCVYEAHDVFYACGTNGIDYSTDKGTNWHPFMYGDFLAMTADEHYLYATMPKGIFMKFNLVK